MAITQSAKKAHRSSLRKRQFNLERKRDYQSVVKKIKKLVKDNKVLEAQALLPQAYKALDKAAKTNYIKKNAASRKKSRLARLITRSGTQIVK